MEEKHEIIAPNFISKPSSMSSPTHAPYKHIATKVELKGIRLTIFKGVNPKLASELVTAMHLTAQKTDHIPPFTLKVLSLCEISY